MVGWSGGQRPAISSTDGDRLAAKRLDCENHNDMEYTTSASRTSSLDEFKFIILNAESPEDQKRNRSLARSHIMKRVREHRRKQAKSPKARKHQFELMMSPGQAGIGSSWREVTAWQKHEPQSASSAFATNMAYGMHSVTLAPSQRTMIETNYPALRSYSKKPTPFLHPFLDHLLNVVWPPYGPPSVKDASAFQTEYFTMIQTSPALFHSSLYLAGTLLDSSRRTNYVINSVEMADHKMEAIHYINQALSKPDVPDAVIMAILGIGMTRAMEEAERKKEASKELDYNSPFAVIQMPPGWQQIYLGVSEEQFHLDGIRTIVHLKGGIEGIRSRPVAKGLSLIDLDEASLHLRSPYFPFQELAEINACVLDPLVNSLAIPTDPLRGSGFMILRDLDSMKDVLAVALDMVTLTAVVEAWSQQTLMNPNLVSLISKRNALQHRLLSLPSGATLKAVKSDVMVSLYECCRLMAMLYSAIAIFPNPPATGCLRRLVVEIKTVLEDMRLKELFGLRTKLYIWAFFLAGVAAQRIPERVWFVERLRILLLFENISCWFELKKILISFLWMDAICDHGGFNLWSEITSEPDNP